jgi:hypothetical protein
MQAITEQIGNERRRMQNIELMSGRREGNERAAAGRRQYFSTALNAFNISHKMHMESEI